MKIECLIRRAGGSRVQMDAPKREYHFKPSDNEQRHIADVDVDSHAKAFLRIKEGYRAVDGENLPKDDHKDEIPDRELKGSAVHNASYQIKGGDEISLEDLVNMAFDDSGLDEQAWNNLPDHERYEYIDTTLSELQNGEQSETAPVFTSVGEPVNATEQQIEADKGTPTVNLQDESKGEPEQKADTAKSSDASATETADDKDANGNGIDDELEELTGKELIPLYEAKFGRKPSRQMKVDDIRRALSEDDD